MRCPCSSMKHDALGPLPLGQHEYQSRWRYRQSETRAGIRPNQLQPTNCSASRSSGQSLHDPCSFPAYRVSNRRMPRGLETAIGNFPASLSFHNWASPAHPLRPLKAAGELQRRAISFITVGRRDLLQSNRAKFLVLTD